MTRKSYTYGILLAIALFALAFVSVPTEAHAQACPRGGTATTGGCLEGSGTAGVFWSQNNQTCPTGSTGWQTTPVRGGQATTGCYDNNTGALVGQTGTTNTINTGSNKPVSCAGTWDTINNPFTCFFRWALSWMGSALIWVGVKIATAAGGIFEYAMKYLIVEFGSLIAQIKTGIDTGWTALRDIANILIIGMFVFIAINIILGVQEFGDKKKVAKVLIVAILINFSLLFTKVIVDASNFTAYQFYNSMVAGIGSQQATTVTTPGGSQDARFNASLTSSGVTWEFMRLLGIEGVVKEDQQKLRELAEKEDGGALYALGFGLLSFIFLIATSFVLLYGAFLIVSRAVLIIFLMLTSALAFASWLIPQHYLEKGFYRWWESLLKAAFFAPILMALLWVTITVARAFDTAMGSKGSLGALAGNASSETTILAVLNFIVILGLLYGSFVAANAFSRTIPAFGMARFAAGVPALAGLALANRVGRFAGRQSFGRVGTGVGQWLEDKAKVQDGAFAKRMYDFGAQRFKGLGNKNFDIMATNVGGKKLGERLQGALGGADIALAGKDKRGFADLQKEFLKRTEKQAGRLELSDEEKQKLRTEGIEKSMPEGSAARNEYDDAVKHLVKAEEHHEQTRRELQKSFQGLQEKLEAIQGDATLSPEEKDRRIATAQREHAGELREQKVRISQARDTATQMRQGLHSVLENVEKAAKESGDIPKAVDKSKADIGKELVQSSYTALLRSAMPSPEGREKLAKKVWKDLKGKEKPKPLGNKTVLDFLKDMDAEKKKARVSEEKALGTFRGPSDSKEDSDGDKGVSDKK